MSAIPLSMKDGGEGNGDVVAWTAGCREVEKSEPENDPLDKLIDSAAEAITTRSKKPEPVPAENMPTLEVVPGVDALDKVISTADAKAEGLEAERKAFTDSRAMRQEVTQRIGAKNFSDVLRAFVDVHGKMRQNPAQAADMLAAQFLMRGYGQSEMHSRFEDAKQEATDPNEHPFRKLDRMLDRALDEKDATLSDEAEFEATKEIRAQLAKEMPGTPFDLMVKRLLIFVRDADRDPVGASERLAASYGLPVTQTQHAMAAYQHQQAEAMGHAHNTIQAFSANAPRLDELRSIVVEALQHPGFVSTGNAYADLQKAYQAAEFVDIARQAVRQSAAAVTKAERAAGRPRSSGSRPDFNSNSNKSDLDSAISRALDRVA